MLRTISIAFALAVLAAAPAAAYTEGAPPALFSTESGDYVASTRQETILQDDRIFTGAKIRIRGVYEREEEAELVPQRRFTNGVYVTVITGTYDSGTGVLTLRGRATGEEYRRALNSVWYQNHGDRPARTRRISVRVRDANRRWIPLGTSTLEVESANDPPRLGWTPIDIGNEPSVVAPGMAVFDPDSRIAGATVRISSGFAPGDRLEFGGTRAITGTYDSGTGVLTLTGTSSVRNYQAALRSVIFTRGSGGDRAFSFDVVDTGGAPSSAEERPYRESDFPMRLAPGAMLDYADSARVTRATVRIRRAEAGERLAFVQQLGITGTYDSGTGILTLRGRASASDYETALRSVWYRHTGDRPSRVRNFVMRVRNGDGEWSGPARHRISVAPVNDAPQADAFSAANEPNIEAWVVALLDPDSRIAGATGFWVIDNDHDNVLSTTAPRGIQGTYDTGTGILTLTGTSSVANYQAALRNVTPARAPEGPIRFQVTDARGATSNTTEIPPP